MHHGDKSRTMLPEDVSVHTDTHSTVPGKKKKAFPAQLTPQTDVENIPPRPRELRAPAAALPPRRAPLGSAQPPALPPSLPGGFFLI